MSRKPTIESLCRKNRNEDIHSQYVARLSLQIFDAVCPYLKLPLSLRPVLKAAALLHDIGYYRKPSDHQAEGSRIVLKKGRASKETNQFTSTKGETIKPVKLTEKQYQTCIAKLRQAGITNAELDLFRQINEKNKS